MANDYITSKWRLWFKSLDVNHDGRISIADMQESRRKFSELHHLEGDQKNAALEGIEAWWNEHILRGKQEIEEQEYIDTLSNEFNRQGKAGFKDRIQKCFNTMFDLVDINHDKMISEEEFLVLFQAYGHENVAMDKNFFEAYNPENKIVPIKRVISSWVDFVTNDDASQPDVIKFAFASAV